MNAGIAAFRAGQAPHIMQVFEVGTATMMSATGAVKPVHVLMKEAGEAFDPKTYLSAITGYYSTTKGEMLSFPFNSSSTVMWYNKDTLQEGGPRRRQAAEDLARGVRRSQEAQGRRPSQLRLRQRLGDLGQPRAAVGLAQRAALHQGQRHGRLRHGAQLQLRRCTSSTWRTLVELQKDKTYDYSGRTNTGEGRFTSGECAIFLTSSAFFGNVRANAKFDFGNAPMPYYPDVAGAPQNSIIGGASLWVMGGKSAQEYKGVAKFFTFLSDTDRQVGAAQEVGLPADHQGGLREDQGVGLLQGVPVPGDAAAGAHQQGADRELARACGSATWCSCATCGPRRSRRRCRARKPPSRRSTTRSPRQPMLRQFERTVSR